MNTMLEKAIMAVADLSDSDQREAAEGLLAFADLVRSGESLLSPEQQEGVAQARLQARQGGFANDDEMAETWRKFDR